MKNSLLVNVFIWIHDTSWLKDKKKLKQISFEIEEGDEDEGTITDINYYSSMPYFVCKDKNDESKHNLIFDSLKELLKREGLHLDEEVYLDRLTLFWLHSNSLSYLRSPSNEHC